MQGLLEYMHGLKKRIQLLGIVKTVTKISQTIDIEK